MRYTPSGVSKVTFGVAVNRSWRNQQTQEWDEQTSFFNVVAWRQLAENVGASLTKGSRVVVSGRLEQRSWETEQGEKRSIVEIVADDVAPSLRFATAEVHQVERSGPGDGGGGPPRRSRARRPRRPAPPATATTTTTAKSRSSQPKEDRSMAQRREKKAPLGKERRPIKKKTSILITESIDWIDYKDVNLLRRFMSERAKVRARRVTGQRPAAAGRGGEGDQARARDGAAAVQRAPGDAALEGPPRPRRSGRPRRAAADREGELSRHSAARSSSTSDRLRRRASRRSSTRTARATTRPRSAPTSSASAAGDDRLSTTATSVMKVVLRDDVDNLGKKGDLVDVADGYARNFLVPRGLALKAIGRQPEAGRRDAPQPRRRATGASARPRRRSPPSSRAARSRSRPAARRRRRLFGSVTAVRHRRGGADPDRRRDRPAQARARRAAQGARRRPTCWFACTPTWSRRSTSRSKRELTRRSRQPVPSVPSSSTAPVRAGCGITRNVRVEPASPRLCSVSVDSRRYPQSPGLWMPNRRMIHRQVTRLYLFVPTCQR